MICDISIIIVNWNTRDLLEQCLHSIQKNITTLSIETIVVDNASSDGSREMVLSLFPETIIIINQENLGFATANNIGIKCANGKYLCLINSDIIVMSNCLQSLFLYMENNPQVGIAGPQIQNPDGSLQPSARRFPTLPTAIYSAIALDTLFPKSNVFSCDFMKFWDHNTIRSVDILSGCFWFVRKSAIDQVGLLDERFFFYTEDVDWCKRFNENGWDIVLYPNAKAIHFGGASSSSEPLRCFVNMMEARCRYWRKHHGRLKTGLWVLINLFHYGCRLIFLLLKKLFHWRMDKDWMLSTQKNFTAIVWLVRSFFGQGPVYRR